MIHRFCFWHRRSGHPNFMYLKQLMPNLFIKIDFKMLHCEVCQLAKQTKNIYLSKNYIPTQPFNRIHSYTWEPSRVANINGARWFITFVVDHTRITWVYLMRHKSETGHITRDFITLVKTSLFPEEDLKYIFFERLPYLICFFPLPFPRSTLRTYSASNLFL